MTKSEFRAFRSKVAELLKDVPRETMYKVLDELDAYHDLLADRANKIFLEVQKLYPQ